MPARNVASLSLLALIVLIFLVVSPHATRQDTLLRNYGPLLEIDALVRRHYVEPVEPGRLNRGAITGLMDALDPHSYYLSPAAFAAYQRRLAGEDVGIGMELETVNNQPTILAVIDGSPASNAGIHTGDVVCAVDGESTLGKTPLEVEGWLGGTPGGSVELSLRRGPEGVPFSVAVTRAAGEVEYVRGVAREGNGWRWMLEEPAKIGYIRVGAFRDTTSEDFDGALEALKGQGVQGLILDLRFNPGGVVAEAVAIVDRFVSEGVIVQTVTRERAGDIYRAHPERTDTALPLVVLINGSTASAAEIVAGSLRDHHRATILGSRSFGKGSVQYILPLSRGGGAVRLTTAYYKLPQGRLVHRTPANIANDSWGITPDVVIELDASARQAILEHRRQVDLPATGRAAASLSTRTDPQLSAAVSLLHSWKGATTPTP